MTHVADFSNPALGDLIQLLHENGERAVPWGAIAIPLDARSFDWEGKRNARWRVFLPLVEEGPCASLLNGAIFIDPSRRAPEFLTDVSQETKRKSLWNKTLADEVLVPLLRNAGETVIANARGLVEDEPERYLSLFPPAGAPLDRATCLTDVVRASFSQDLWQLKLFDIWRKPFNVIMGSGGDELRLEIVPEWLARYKDTFRELTTDGRRFVPRNVGQALSKRLGEGGNVKVTKTGADVADRVLLADQAPLARDLPSLLKVLDEQSLTPSGLKGRWALQRKGGDESLLRFDSESLYLVRTNQTPPVYDALSAIGLSFIKAEWVAPEVGLSALQSDRIGDFPNVRTADEIGALELLRRAGRESRHDFASDHYKIVPIVDFLCSQEAHRLTPDLRLAFLLKTAAGTVDRRYRGVVFLRPDHPTPDEEDLWQGLLREAFAQVHPQFAPQLRRLLDHAPPLLTCLGDDTCDVNLARGNLLDLLCDVRIRDPDFVARLAHQLNSDADGAGDRCVRVYRATRLLLREADRRWDSMEQRVRDSVLILPIHRTAEGTMTSLRPGGNESLSEIANRFFLQSEDDLRDAPLELPEGQLLHSLDPEVRSFYRRRLGIRERGRIEVLKECLRQIGDDATRSVGLLKYVERHYRDAVEQLRERGGDGEEDLRELDELHGTARGIPCLDGSWRSAAKCVDASSLRPLLERRGWERERLDKLLCQLGYPRPVAEVSSEAGKRARRLWETETLDQDALAELAITSESPDLRFADRVRVIADNLNLVPETPPTRAAVISHEICEALGQPVELVQLVLVRPDEIGLGNDALRVIVPGAADLPRLAAKLTGGRVPVLAAVLRALGVQTVDEPGLRSRVVANFAAIWSGLDTGPRLSLLAWLGDKGETLPPDAPNLDTVLVGKDNGEWVPPSDVVAPSWAKADPPNVPATNIARTAGIAPPVLRLWEQWCGLRDLGAVVGKVVRSTSELPREQWPAAGKRLARWLEELAGFKGADAVTAALGNLEWVLARKGDELAFKPSKQVLDHPGAEVLQDEFWVVQEKIATPLARSVQTLQLEGTRKVLEAIARCLASSSSAGPAAAKSIYELLVQLTSDEQASEIWRAVARSSPAGAVVRLDAGQIGITARDTIGTLVRWRSLRWP